MNFFKTLLSDDPDPTEPENDQDSGTNSTLKAPPDDGNRTSGANAWSFGDLIKTIATQSESVIETYRKDLLEFQSGLKKETEIFRETASRAVKDLPASLEAGASAAHGALDGVIKSTAEIISKETQALGAGGEPETIRNLSAGRYSWFQAQLRAIQSDLNAFCEVPEDEEEYGKWKLGFKLEEYEDEIGGLIGENGTLEGVYNRVVPSAVDSENFWSRYFYRVDKLKQQESVRANLVRMAISIDDEEELSWDVDDEEEEGEDGKQSKEADGLGGNVGDQKDLNNGSQNEKEGNNLDVDDGVKSSVDGKKEVKSEESVEGKNEEKVGSEKKIDSGEKSDSNKEVNSEEVAETEMDEKVKSEESVKEKNDEKVCVEEKKESIKTSDALRGSSLESKAGGEEEEDMGWDEIEDTGSGDEKKVSGSTNRNDLHKRLSAAAVDDDEDLNWDIEDDDEPLKA